MLARPSTPKWSTWRHRTILAGLAIAGLLGTSVPAAAQLQVSSEIWMGEEFDENGNIMMYGKAYSTTDYGGWVTATATLRDPSGNPLDIRIDGGVVSAVANVSTSINAYTVADGEFSTLAQGEDSDEYIGCQYVFMDLLFSEQAFTKRSPEAQCGFNTRIYDATCTPEACSVGSATCLPLEDPYAVCLRVRLTIAFVSWCPDHWR